MSTLTGGHWNGNIAVLLPLLATGQLLFFVLLAHGQLAFLAVGLLRHPYKKETGQQYANCLIDYKLNKSPNPPSPNPYISTW
ncbi:hypothetical protein Back11_17160 [Paenibacillus baekrokdamisoli]|uniref:Uncharacterized protein n=1 Tax=Paenibacillus baekrokdamisoli TaxID=1712516 RepID=A0A3G9J3I7_9BACL|nr:hypothetical protein [Paenibacillus baekrokdamisoli]MBB3072069.1 hypothetical protein [Paenibacillus baekrokdamisoli]BBH20371.1 hypothetical protein Back11_17160 [Paenibacillus baekrokdamisoli]